MNQHLPSSAAVFRTLDNAKEPLPLPPFLYRVLHTPTPASVLSNTDIFIGTVLLPSTTTTDVQKCHLHSGTFLLASRVSWDSTEWGNWTSSFIAEAKSRKAR